MAYCELGRVDLVAERLGITPAAVKGHLWMVYRSVGANGPAQALWTIIGGPTLLSLVEKRLG